MAADTSKALRQQVYDIIAISHLIGKHCRNWSYELSLAYYMRPMLFQGSNMRFISGYQINVESILLKISPENRPEASCSVNTGFHASSAYPIMSSIDAPGATIG